MGIENQIVLVCRPKIQSERLTALLSGAGAQPVGFAPIGILPQPAKLSGLNALFLRADWVVFVSPSAIDVAASFLDFKNFSGSLFWVGQPSAEKLRQISGKNVYYPDGRSDSSALLQLPVFEQAFGKTVLIIRGEGGRAELVRALNEKGAQVFVQEVYQRVRLALDWSLLYSLNQTGRLRTACVTSGDIAEALFSESPAEALMILKELFYIVPHERIRERLHRLGATHIMVSDAGDENMVNCLTGVVNSL